MPQPPNMQQMMRQVQKMQQDMMEAQEQLKHEEVEASAGGGMVKVKVSGDLVVKAITIAPDAIDPDDPELLQDMVLAAVNEAMRQADELRSDDELDLELDGPAAVSEDELIDRFIEEFDATVLDDDQGEPR